MTPKEWNPVTGHGDDVDPWREDLWDLIEQTPNLDWLLLTKRPENIAQMLPPRWMIEPGNLLCDTCGASASLPLGMTCADHQPRATGMPLLLNVPAAIRFLSCEPLLGPVNLRLRRCGDG